MSDNANTPPDGAAIPDAGAFVEWRCAGCGERQMMLSETNDALRLSGHNFWCLRGCGNEYTSEDETKKRGAAERAKRRKLEDEIKELKRRLRAGGIFGRMWRRPFGKPKP